MDAAPENADSRSDTPSGLPLGAPSQAAAEFIQDTVIKTLGQVFANPNELAASAAAGITQGVWQGMTTPTPGRSALYYYGWAGGCGAVAGANYYLAYKLPSDQQLARVVLLLQGTALVAAAALNLSKATKAGR